VPARGRVSPAEEVSFHNRAYSAPGEGRGLMGEVPWGVESRVICPYKAINNSVVGPDGKGTCSAVGVGVDGA